MADPFPGLQVIDISQPVNPRRVGGCYTGSYAYDVAAVGDCAYLADGSAGLQVLDVGNPTNCVPVGLYDTTGSDAWGVAVVGDTICVTDLSAGLVVWR